LGAMVLRVQTTQHTPEISLETVVGGGEEQVVEHEPGYCYLLCLKASVRGKAKRLLGPYPTLLQLLDSPDDWLHVKSLRRLYVTEAEEDCAHLGEEGTYAFKSVLVDLAKGCHPVEGTVACLMAQYPAVKNYPFFYHTKLGGPWSSKKSGKGKEPETSHSEVARFSVPRFPPVTSVEIVDVARADFETWMANSWYASHMLEDESRWEVLWGSWAAAVGFGPLRSYPAFAELRALAEGDLHRAHLAACAGQSVLRAWGTLECLRRVIPVDQARPRVVGLVQRREWVFSFAETLRETFSLEFPDPNKLFFQAVVGALCMVLDVFLSGGMVALGALMRKTHIYNLWGIDTNWSY